MVIGSISNRKSHLLRVQWPWLCPHSLISANNTTPVSTTTAYLLLIVACTEKSHSFHSLKAMKLVLARESSSMAAKTKAGAATAGLAFAAALLLLLGHSAPLASAMTASPHPWDDVNAASGQKTGALRPLCANPREPGSSAACAMPPQRA